MQILTEWLFSILIINNFLLVPLAKWECHEQDS